MEEEKIKKKNNEAEKIADIENKDKNSLVYDEESHRHIDIDDILTGDFKIAKKINNLSKFGVNREQVKKMYEMSADISNATDLDGVIKELEKVFVILAVRINSNPQTGIVIDLSSGKEDVILSMQKCNELNIDYETFETKTKEEQLEIKDIIFEIASKEISAEELSNFYIEDFSNTFDGFFEIDYEEYQNFYINLGITLEDLKQNEEKNAFVFLETIEDVNMIEALYKYLPKLKNKDNTKTQIELLQILGTNKNSKYYKELVNENGTIDLEKLEEFQKKWENDRNEFDVDRKLSNLALAMDKEMYENSDAKDRAKVTIAILRALRHLDNTKIKKIFDSLAENLEIDISENGIKQLVYDTLGIRITNQEELDKLINTYEVNNQTIEKELVEPKESIHYKDPEDEKKGTTIEKIQIQSKKREIRSFQSKAISNILNLKLNNTNVEIKDYRALEFIAIYNMYNKSSINEVTKRALEEYIDINKDYLKEYFAKEGKEIFNKDGKISKKQVEKIAISTVFPEYIKENMEEILSTFEKMEKYSSQIRNQNENSINKLNEIIRKKELSINDEKVVLRVLNKIDYKVLDERMVRELERLKSKAINDKVNEVLLKNKIKNSNLENDSKKNYNEVMHENMILLEAKVEFSKGTADYNNYLKEKEEYLEKNGELRKQSEELRDENGELTLESKNKITKYVDKLLYESLKLNISKTSVKKLREEEKPAFTTFLLAGISDKNLENRLIAIEKLKELYPQLSEIEDERTFKNEVFSLIYGKEIKDDFGKIESKAQEIKNNLIIKIINEKKIIDLSEIKVSERDIVTIMEKAGVDMEVADINLSKSEMQNMFNNSEIEFTDEDQKNLNELYKNTTVNSWISDKKDVFKYDAVWCYMLLEEIKENGEYGLGKGSYESYSHRLNRVLEKNNELKEQFENNPKFIKESVKEVEVYSQNKLMSDLLEKFKNNILLQAKNYERLSGSDKKTFLRYLLYANKSIETVENIETKQVLQKLCNRTFEMMNTEDKKYIDFDKKGNGVLNKELIVNEVNSIYFKKNPIENFSDLQEFIARRHSLLYIPVKMFEYGVVEDTYFRELKGENIDEKLKEIEYLNMVRVEKLKEHKELIRKGYKKNILKEADRENTVIEKKDGEENQSEYKKEQENQENEAQVKEISIDEINIPQKATLIDKLQGFFNRLKQPKLTDGNGDLVKKDSTISKVINGIKNIFIKNKEKYQKDNVTKVLSRNEQKNDFDERLKAIVNEEEAIEETEPMPEKKQIQQQSQLQLGER